MDTEPVCETALSHRSLKLDLLIDRSWWSYCEAFVVSYTACGRCCGKYKLEHILYRYGVS